MSRAAKILEGVFESSNKIIDNDEYYCNNIYVFHTTSSKTLERIKALGKLIPTDHMFFGKSYPNRLHLTIDHGAHVNMIIAIADDKPDFELDDLYTLVINYPCKFVTDNWFDIEYKDLKPDNNAGYNGYDFYTDKEIPLSRVDKIMPFHTFRVSRDY